MSTTQYTSIHSGVDIDRAVSYYKSIDSYGRSVINYPIEGYINEEQNGDWKLVTSADGTDKTKLSGVTANYYIKITLSGVYKIGGAPIVYFVDNTGQKWEIDHIFDEGILNPQEKASYSIYCLSNTNIYSGCIVMVGTLSNTKDGDGNMTITVETNSNILKQSPTEISDSTEVLEGVWSQTEFAEPDSMYIAKYVTKIVLPAGYNKVPIALLKGEDGFVYNMPARVYDGYFYVYTNIIPPSGKIIVKL